MGAGDDVQHFRDLRRHLVRIDWLGGANNRLYHSGKHRHHGVNLQGLTDPYGRLTWISAGLPGPTHDLTAARHHDVLVTVDRAGLPLFADKGDVDGEADLLLLPSQGRHLPTAYAANRSHAAIRARGQLGFAALKNWHILDRVRACPRRTGPSPKPSSPSKTKDEKGSTRPRGIQGLRPTAADRVAGDGRAGSPARARSSRAPGVFRPPSAS